MAISTGDGVHPSITTFSEGLKRFTDVLVLMPGNDDDKLLMTGYARELHAIGHVVLAAAANRTASLHTIEAATPTIETFSRAVAAFELAIFKTLVRQQREEFDDDAYADELDKKSLKELLDEGHSLTKEFIDSSEDVGGLGLLDPVYLLVLLKRLIAWVIKYLLYAILGIKVSTKSIMQVLKKIDRIIPGGAGGGGAVGPAGGSGGATSPPGQPPGGGGVQVCLISVYLDSITSADDLTGIGTQGWSITSTFIDPQSGKSMDNTEKTQKGDFDHVTPPTGAPGYWKFPVLDKNKLLQVLNAQQCGPGTVKVKFHIESPAVGGSADVDINIPFTCGTQTSANSSIAINPTVHSAVTLTIKLTVTSTCVSTASPR